MKRFFIAVMFFFAFFSSAQAQNAGYEASHVCHAKEDQARQALEDAKEAYKTHRLSFWDLGEAMKRSIEAQSVESFDRCYKKEKQKRGNFLTPATKLGFLIFKIV